MIKHCFIFVGILGFASEVWASVNSIVTLPQAFENSLKISNEYSIQKTKHQQSQATDDQIRGALFPTVKFIGSYLKQDSPTPPLTGLKTDQTNARLNLRQALFDGTSFYALDVNREVTKSQNFKIEKEKLNLLATVSQAYFQVALGEKDLEDLEVLIGLTEKRVSELNSRTKIGRSRKSELLSAQSQAATLRAQRVQAKQVLEKNRFEFERVSGLPRDSELEKECTLIPTALAPIDSFLGQLEALPQIQASESSFQSSQFDLKRSKTAHWPTLDFETNYHLRRPGTFENVKWDATVTFTMALFRGGSDQAAIEKAAFAKAEKEVSFSKEKDDAGNQIKVNYQDVASSLELILVQQEAFKIAEDNYKEQNRDYGLGLSSNLDVLQAMNTLQEAKRSLDRVKFQMCISWVKLQASAGRYL